ncbi:MAG: LysM peptidoglycan-binding domain-containing protein [Ardenticatenaceae bacterium]|nr:LysM peptidoglycan-binding domain-containing protein [Ardenticatenaceae bacterium]
MKQRSFSLFSLAILMIVAIMALTACELPSDRSEPIQLDAAPLTDPTQLTPVIPPTVDPNAPAADLTPAAEQTPGTEGQGGETAAEPATGEGGEQPAEGQPAGQETAGEESVETRQTQTYIVQSGDTLGQIAQRFDVSIEDIAAASNLLSVDTLDVGQELIIPGDDYVPPEPTPTTAPPEGQAAATETPPTEAPATGEQEHVVQRGENLYRIGLQYGFTVAELQTYNGLANPNDLDVGQVIKIPPSE